MMGPKLATSHTESEYRIDSAKVINVTCFQHTSHVRGIQYNNNSFSWFGDSSYTWRRHPGRRQHDLESLRSFFGLVACDINGCFSSFGFAYKTKRFSRNCLNCSVISTSSGNITGTILYIRKALNTIWLFYINQVCLTYPIPQYWG